MDNKRLKKSQKGFRPETTSQYMLQKQTAAPDTTVISRRPQSPQPSGTGTSQPSRHERSRSQDKSGPANRSEVTRSGSTDSCRPRQEHNSKHTESASGVWTVVQTDTPRKKKDKETVVSVDSQKKRSKRGPPAVTCISLCESDEDEGNQTTSSHKKESSKKKHTRHKSRDEIQNQEIICIDEIEPPAVKKANLDPKRWKTSSYSKEEAGRENGDSKQRSQQQPDRKQRRQSLQSQARKSSSELVDLLWLTDESQMLMVLSHPQEVCFQGKMMIRSLFGSVDVLGFTITNNNREYPVYSAASNSLLTISTLPGRQSSSSFNRDAVFQEILRQAGQENKSCLANLRNQINARTVVLLLKQLPSSVCNFVTSIYPFHQLFSRNKRQSSKNAPSASVEVEIMSDPLRRWTLAKDYSDISQRFTQQLREGISPTLLVCGGKNVGKSSLARYLINCGLNHCDCVAYLECDVGQTEFTPSGCLSLSLVSQPLLGPPFTHQNKPEYMCYFGGLSPADEPVYYSRCLATVFEALQQLNKSIPLVVNSMGWNKGMGLQFLADTVRLVQPDIVLQLESDNRYKNMPPVTSDFVYLTGHAPGFTPSQLSEENKKHELVILPSPVDPHLESSDRYKAIDQRNLSLLSYVGGLQPSVCGSPWRLTAAQPYQLPWHTVAVHVCNTAVPNSQILAALNASIVGLCVVPPNTTMQPSEPDMPRFLRTTPVCQCLGFGLIRSIDPAEKMFYILTPEPLSTLRRVNCLMKGALNLPDQLMLTQTLGHLDIPYVGYSKDTLGASNIRPRRHMVRKLAKDPS